MSVPRLPEFTPSVTSTFKVPITHSNSGTSPSRAHSADSGSESSRDSYSSSEERSYTTGSPTSRTNPTNGPKTSDNSYAKSFSIATRLRYALSKPTKKQIAISLIIIVLVIAAIVVGFVFGLKHIAKAESLKSRPDLEDVRTPTETESIVGLIKGQPPQKREFNFIIEERLGWADGVQRSMLVVNGVYPGPIVEVNQADEVVVHVQNHLQNATSIHWHGLLHTGTNYYDGLHGVTQCGIPAGGNMTYTFTPGNFSGTSYWRAGYGTQAVDGLSGGLIVHPTRSNIPIQYEEEVFFHLSDLYHKPSNELLSEYLSPEGTDHSGQEPVPDSGTINGIGRYQGSEKQLQKPLEYYELSVETGKSYRLRLVNGGAFAPIRFSIDSHNFTVVEADGVEVQPVEVAGGIVLEVGQRYSVIFKATDQPGDVFWIRADFITDQFKYPSPNANVEIKGVLKYGKTENKPIQDTKSEPGSDLDILQLSPLVVIPPPAPTKTYVLEYKFNKTTDGKTVAMINSNSWLPLQNTNSVLSKLGEQVEGLSLTPSSQLVIAHRNREVVDLIIDNLSGGIYSFSLSGHRPWVIDSGSGRYGGGVTPTQATNVTGPSSSAQSTDVTTAPPPDSTPTAPSNQTSTPLTTSSASSQRPQNDAGRQAVGSFTSPANSNSNTQQNKPKASSSQRTGKHRSAIPRPSNETQRARQRIFFQPSKTFQPKSSTTDKHIKSGSHDSTSGYNDRIILDGSSTVSSSAKLHPRQLTSTTGSAPLQRDTFLLPKDGWIRIRFVADNPGVWLLSDQNQWHLAAGAGIQIASMTSQPLQVPKSMSAFCVAP